MTEDGIPVDPNKLIERLTHQNAMMNRQLIMQSIAIEEMSEKIKELESGNASGSITGDASLASQTEANGARRPGPSSARSNDEASARDAGRSGNVRPV